MIKEKQHKNYLMRKNIDSITGIAKTKRDLPGTGKAIDRWEHYTEFKPQKKSFEKKRAEIRNSIAEDNQTIKAKQAEIKKIDLEIERGKKDLQGIGQIIENYRNKHAGKKNIDYIISTLELEKGNKESDLNTLIVERNYKVKELENDIDELKTGVSEKESTLKNFEEGRKEKIQEKVNLIKEKYGYDVLTENKNDLNKDIEELKSRIKEKKEELQPIKEALAIFKENKSFASSISEIEKEIKRLEDTKAEAEKRKGEIEKRLAVIKTKYTKWENLINSERLNRQGKNEAEPTPVSDAESIPDDNSGSEETPDIIKSGLPSGFGELMDDMTKGMRLDKDASSTTPGRAETAPDANAENKELTPEQKIAGAKSIANLRVIVFSLDMSDSIFEKFSRSEILRNLYNAEQSGDPSSIKSVPNKYGLADKAREILSENKDKETEETEPTVEIDPKTKYFNLARKIDDSITKIAKAEKDLAGKTNGQDAEKLESELDGYTKERDNLINESREILGGLSKEDIYKMVESRMKDINDVMNLNILMYQIPDIYIPDAEKAGIWDASFIAEELASDPNKINECNQNIEKFPEVFGFREKLRSIINEHREDSRKEQKKIKAISNNVRRSNTFKELAGVIKNISDSNTDIISTLDAITKIESIIGDKNKEQDKKDEELLNIIENLPKDVYGINEKIMDIINTAL